LKFIPPGRANLRPGKGRCGQAGEDECDGSSDGGGDGDDDDDENYDDDMGNTGINRRPPTKRMRTTRDEDQENG
jgi:hypothetical protein